MTNTELAELVAYDDLKKKMEGESCKACDEKSRRATRTCFWCGESFRIKDKYDSD